MILDFLSVYAVLSFCIIAISKYFARFHFISFIITEEKYLMTLKYVS